MSIKINWHKVNRDDQFSGYEVYRSTDKENVYLPDNKVASISDKNQITFTDNEAILGNKYYYGIVTKSASGDLKSRIQVTRTNFAPCIGGEDVIIGDNTLGLIGHYYDDETIRLHNYVEGVISDALRGIGGLVTPTASPTFMNGYETALNKIIVDGDISVYSTIGKLAIGPNKSPAAIWNAIINNLHLKINIEFEGRYYKIKCLTKEELEAFWFPNFSTTGMQSDFIKVITSSNPATRCFVLNPDTMLGTLQASGTISYSGKNTSDTAISYNVCVPWALIPIESLES